MSKHADITFKNDIFSLSGELDFYNVMSVYQKSIPYLKANNSFIFDFSNLHEGNSAALALIIEWIKYSKEHGKSISFKSISPKLLSIAKLGGLEAFNL